MKKFNKNRHCRWKNHG